MNREKADGAGTRYVASIRCHHPPEVPCRPSVLHTLSSEKLAASALFAGQETPSVWKVWVCLTEAGGKARGQ